MSAPEEERECSHCKETTAKGREAICADCKKLPRCEVCEVFFGGLVNPSKENKFRCDGCLDFEDNIEFFCHICGDPIPLYATKNSKVLNYQLRGNSCGPCNTEAREAAELARVEDPPQFVGYLAILEKKYIEGDVSKEEWERIIIANPQDVTSWKGLEYLKELEESE